MQRSSYQTYSNVWRIALATNRNKTIRKKLRGRLHKNPLQETPDRPIFVASLWSQQVILSGTDTLLNWHGHFPRESVQKLGRLSERAAHAPARHRIRVEYADLYRNGGREPCG